MSSARRPTVSAAPTARPAAGRVLTRDATAYCGNGEIDAITSGTTEACDIRVENGVETVVGPVNCRARIEADLPVTPARGFSMSAELRPQRRERWRRRAKAAFEPVVNASSQGNVATSTSDERWPERSFVGLYVPRVYDPGLIFDEVEYDAPVFNHRPFTVESPPYAISARLPYTTEQHLFTDIAASTLLPGEGIESSADCRDEYFLRFDDEVQPVTEEILRDFGAGTPGQDRRIPGDFFPYSVNGEPTEVQNEYIVSPPVPADVYRIVVRWGDAERDFSFSGMVYHESYAGAGQGSVVGYTRAFTDTQANRGLKICYDMSEQADPGTGGPSPNYWWPTGCDPYYGTAFVHPLRGLTHTFTHALTLRTNRQDPVTPILGTNPFAFFVDAIGVPMYDFQDSPTLKVEVYEARYGNFIVGGRLLDQNSLFSIFLPSHTYEIDLAERSSHQEAEYWHVFNIVRETAGNPNGPYVIQPVGASGHGTIESDFQGILDTLANLP